ncbi:hypothetical protein KHP62_20880 [Rhodobacteraceae bacterium NNCM2]|nr:hypothetical protein [Coraliihabitans acroporae]
MQKLEETLVTYLRDWRAGWNIGSFGAIAEFHQDKGEAAEVEGPLERATGRGAIRIERTSGVTPVAWEALSKNPERWQQGVALCLPNAEATRATRTVLTELGPDEAAIRPTDQGAILFDMGLAQRNVDFCIRTADEGLLSVLRANLGRSLGEPGNPAMKAILGAHPHRVALSGIGRCEVYQMIGGPDTGGKSPEGPHTHVLPELLKAGRTHSANVPIPEGLVPAMTLHPGNPVMTPLGECQDFNPDLFYAFQGLLSQWGPASYVETKRRVWQALDNQEPPEPEEKAQSRLDRVARRNALRQRARAMGATSCLAMWSAAHDRGSTIADADMIGH